MCSSHECCCLIEHFITLQTQSAAASCHLFSGQHLLASFLSLALFWTLHAGVIRLWCDQPPVHLPLLSVFSHFPQAVAASRHFYPCWLFLYVSAPCLVHPVTNGWQSQLFLIFSCIEHAAVSLQAQAFVEACVFSSLGFLPRSGVAEPYGNSLVACRGNTRPAPKGYNTVCSSQPVLYSFQSSLSLWRWIPAVLGHAGTVLCVSPAVPARA